MPSGTMLHVLLSVGSKIHTLQSAKFILQLISFQITDPPGVIYTFETLGEHDLFP